jgi:hypothetical protein
MADNSTPFWFKVITAILVPLSIGAATWYLTEVQIQNSAADLFLKASHDLSSDDPIKVVTALGVLDTAVKDKKALKTIREKVKKVQSTNIRKMIPSDPDKALALYDVLKETTGMDETFENLKEQAVTRVDRYAQARKFEVEGFQLLIAGKYSEAINSFQKAEDTVPGYHWVFEIIQLLKQKLPSLIDSAPELTKRTRKEVLSTILGKYSGKAPQDFLDKARKEVLEALPLGAKAIFGAESSLEHSGGEPKGSP